MPSLSAFASVGLPVFLGTINLLVVLGNLAVLYILVSQKSLHTSTNSIVFSLTLSDFLLGCLILPFSISQEFSNNWHFGTLWCKSWLSLDILLSTASIYNLLAISFDRYMAVIQPIKYGRLISSSRLTKFTISAVWLISGALALPPFVSDLFLVTASKLEMELLLDTNYTDAVLLEFANTCTPVTNSDLYILFSATISFILPMILMVGLNASIFCTVLDSKRKLSQSPFPARSFSTASTCANVKQQQMEEVGRILRVHRGGSSRTPTMDGALTKEQLMATIASSKSRHSLNMLKKASMNLQMPSPILHQQSLPSTAINCASSVSLDHNSSHNGFNSLPSTRMDNCFVAVAGLSTRGDTFSTSLDSSSIASTMATERTGHAHHPPVGSGQRKQSILRQIWQNRIKRIKLSQQQKRSQQPSFLWFPPSCASSTRDAAASPDLQPAIINMKRLLEQEAALRSMPAVRKPSIIERTADRTVWFPAVVTSLFAGNAKRSVTVCRRQSERLLLYPSLQFAKNSLCTELRVARTIAVVVGCFTCCWLPFTIIYVLQAFHLCPVGVCVPDWLFTLSFWLGYSNSAINPLLYAAFSRDFRNAFYKLLMRDRNSSFRSSA